MKNTEALNEFHTATKAVLLLVGKDGSETWLEYTEKEKARTIAAALRSALAKVNTAGIQVFGPFELAD